MELQFADVPDDLWNRIALLLPAARPKPLGGRPPVADRVVMAGIVYRLKTGCQWKALPSNFGSGSTCHLRFQQWRRTGVFARIYAEMLRYYDHRKGAQLTWTSLDSASVKAPKGGRHRPKPDGSRKARRQTAHPD
jgi:transposase